MKKFAKVINLKMSQCLVRMEYNSLDETVDVIATVQIGKVQGNMKWSHEDEREARIFFNKFNMQRAQNVYDTLVNTLAVPQYSHLTEENIVPLRS